MCARLAHDRMAPRGNCDKVLVFNMPFVASSRRQADQQIGIAQEFAKLLLPRIGRQTFNAGLQRDQPLT